MKKAIGIIICIFSLWTAASAGAREIVPSEFAEELMEKKAVSLIHDEDDDKLSLVPDCSFAGQIKENRVKKTDSPYTAEFLYLISKKDLIENGTKNLTEISIGEIAKVFTAVSNMSGMRYRFGENNKKGSVLYKKVCTISDLEDSRRIKEIPDRVTDSCNGLEVFCYQHDRLLDDIKFVLNYYQTDRELYLTITTKTDLGLWGFKACFADNLKISIHVTDLGDEVLFYIAADANYENVLKMFSIRKFIKKLMNERLDAIYRWFFIQF